jgi:small subunit ribosomal protein S4e
MGRGPKKHLKRLNAPKHWMLAKLTGKWAPRPSTGPHKLRECLPLVILLRNRLRYALTRREVVTICAQRFVKVDGVVRTDTNYPAGFMDVITIEKTNETFRLLYDTKGRFAIHRITPEEGKFKLLKIRKVSVGLKGIPYVVSNDGRTIRYPDPLIKAGDTVKFNLVTGKIEEHIKFESGCLAMVTSGKNLGRIGVVEHKERHLGSFDIVHLKDAAGHKFTTRGANVFALGHHTSLISLPRNKGVRLTILQERERRLLKKSGAAVPGEAISEKRSAKHSSKEKSSSSGAKKSKKPHNKSTKSTKSH